jgi:GT2 family glycosyltransferase
VDADYLGGISLLARAEVVNQTGGMDEDLFLYWEDVDWCLRTRKKGWRLAYCPPSRVWHKGGATTGHGSPSQDYYTVRNSLFIAARHYPAFVPSILLYSLFRCLLPKLCRFQFARARAVLRAYGHFLINRRGKGW